MKWHPVFRGMAMIAALTLLVTAVGCSTPADQTPADDHGTTAATDEHGHDHGSHGGVSMAYTQEADGTYTLMVTDGDGHVLHTQPGLAGTAVSTQITDTVVELSWVINNHPGGYQCLYVDREGGRVSDMIVGEQATDGNRIVCCEVKDGKLNVTVRDLFDAEGYSKVTVIDDAYTAGEYTVLGAVKYTKDQVNVSYLTDKNGGHRITTFSLYEQGEERPADTDENTDEK